MNLSPYKALGPDSIPNIVLKECSDLLTPSLTVIFNAILDLNTYYNPWNKLITIVIRKPGKPNYKAPKAYRPIALISTLAKLLTAIVAENFSNITETFKLLPNNHFSNCPGHSTADAIHYLTNKILHTWHTNKVASILFLDVEGAFPNTVTSRLLHNLKKRRTPCSIVNFVEQLNNRKTRLKFNNYTSEPIPIQNGIGQGDPLSMLLYIYYNTDILDTLVNQEKEDAIGYVDDIALIAIGDNFKETTSHLENLMTKPEGSLEWSHFHNSKFEVNKSAVMHSPEKPLQTWKVTDMSQFTNQIS